MQPYTDLIENVIKPMSLDAFLETRAHRAQGANNLAKLLLQRLGDNPSLSRNDIADALEEYVDSEIGDRRDLCLR